MPGESRLSRRKKAQRNETSRNSCIFLAIAAVLVLLLAGRANWKHEQLIPGLLMVAPTTAEVVKNSLEVHHSLVDPMPFVPSAKLKSALLNSSSSSIARTSNIPTEIIKPAVASADTSVVVAPVQSARKSLLRGSVKRPRIAFAITITKDGPFQDGAAVLAYSIISSFANNDEYDISLLAFVHPNVSTSRPVLKKIGFHVIEAPTPIKYVSQPVLLLLLLY
jgi:hypothetical protein